MKRPSDAIGLKRKLQRQLDRPSVISGGHGAEIARTKVDADSAVEGVPNPLRVVPNVEELRAELEIGTALFVEYEVLEERNIPVVPAGATNGIVWFVAPGSRGRHGEDRSIEPLLDGVRILHRAIYVWTV